MEYVDRFGQIILGNDYMYSQHRWMDKYNHANPAYQGQYQQVTRIMP